MKSSAEWRYSRMIVVFSILSMIGTNWVKCESASFCRVLVDLCLIRFIAVDSPATLRISWKKQIVVISFNNTAAFSCWNYRYIHIFIWIDICLIHREICAKRIVRLSTGRSIQKLELYSTSCVSCESTLKKRRNVSNSVLTNCNSTVEDCELSREYLVLWTCC